MMHIPYFLPKLPKPLALINEELDNAERLFVSKSIALEHTITQLEKDRIDVGHYEALVKRLREMQKLETDRLTAQKIILAEQKQKNVEKMRML
jgi:hypothetical protein